MKFSKVVLLTSLIAVGASAYADANAPSPYAGFSGAVSLDINAAQANTQKTDNGVKSAVRKQYAAALYGNVWATYRYVMNKNYVLGLHVVGGYSNNKNTSGSTTLATSYHYGVGAELGYIYKNNLFALMTGPVWTRLKYTVGSDTNTQTPMSWLVGFNAEQPLGNKFSVFEAFSYVFVKDFTLKAGNYAFNATTSHAYNGQIGLRYTF